MLANIEKFWASQGSSRIASVMVAWASDQSQEAEGRFALERKVAEYALQFGVGPVPRPPHWVGFRITPSQIEFWRDGAFRLHDRMQYQRSGDGWTRRRLYP